MSTQRRSYVIRLSAEGQRQLQADLKMLGASGEKSLKAIQRAGKPASAGLKATDRAARDLKEGLRSVGQELPAVQRLARFMGTTALAGGLIAFGKSSLDVARLFQASMKRVEGALRASEADMVRLTAAARDMGASTAFTASQAADAIEVLAKNGLKVDDILGGALEATLAMAGALGGELAPSADLATDIMQQFGLAAADLPVIADRIAGAALTSKFGFDDLRLAIGQAGGVAGKFGLDVDEFLTTLSLTAAGFSSGSDAGTSFKNFLQRFTPQSKQAEAAMAKLNLEFFDAAGNMKSMEEIAGMLQDSVAGLSEEARNSALQTIFGTDAIRTALLLASSGAEGFRELASALSEVSAADQAQVRLQGLDGALKELASAWEALQLASAESGGLDVAEEAVDRLTNALRYLGDNFEEVEEVAERVAQALVTFLVGRGITLAIAKSVAMRAAYIELAGSVSGVGTAASRSLGPLTRLGVAGRVLMGTLGGPLTLAVTAASLLALGLDSDKAADAIESADAASRRAAEALDAYREASRRAAEEQKSLGGEVSEATQRMVEQSLAGLNAALAQAESKLSEARAALSDGTFLFGTGESALDDLLQAVRGPNDLARYRNAQVLKAPNPDIGDVQAINPFLERMGDLVELLANGRIEVADFAREWDALGGVPVRIQQVARELQGVLDAGLMGTEQFDQLTSILVSAAQKSDLFESELAAVNAASSDPEKLVAWQALAEAMQMAGEASRLMHENLSDDQREMISTYVEANERVGELNDAIHENLGLVAEVDAAGNPFQAIEDGARDAAVSVEKLTGLYQDYAASRIASSAMPESFGATMSALASASTGAEASARLLRHFEGFKSLAYDDGKRDSSGNRVGPAVWRAGFGSDTITLADGSVRKITQGMRVSVEDANRDLARRIGEFQAGVIRQVGAERFASFTPAQQSGLTSIAYNYGDLPDRILAAVREGSNREIAAAIVSLQNDNGGINSDRRLSEAALFREDVGVEQSAARQEKEQAEAAAEAQRAAIASAEQRARVMKAEEEALARLVSAGNEQVAQLQLEASLAGKTAAEQARLLYIHEKLTEAKRAGIDANTQLTASGELLIDVIRRQAAAVGADAAARQAARSETDADIAKMSEARDAVQSAFDNFKKGGDGLKGFLGDVFGFIADKLWDLAFDPLWDTLASGLSTLLGGGGSGFLGSFLGRADGGSIPRLASGGMPQVGGRANGTIPGSGGKRQDNILLWGSPGEFMQPAAAVDFYGVDFMEAIRQRRLPRFADGGLLGPGASRSPGMIADATGRSVVELRMRLPDGVSVEDVEVISGRVAVRTIALAESARDQGFSSRVRELEDRGI